VQGLPTPSLPRSERLELLVETYFTDGWVHRDLRRRGLDTMIRRGVFTEFDFTTIDEIKASSYYQEYLLAHGLAWIGGVKVAVDDDVWCVAIQRSWDEGPFSPEEIGRLAAMSRRLSSSAALARALSFARLDAAMAAFEMSASAIVMLDHRSEVTRMNDAAERLIGTDLRIVRRRLVSFDRAATTALDRALHRLLLSPEPTALMPPVALPRRDGRPVLAYPVRLSDIMGEPLGPCHAILVLVDLDRRVRPPDAVLQESLGVTRAEARLCGLLASGSTLHDAADQIGITKETARGQLKAIFAKTQTHRQAELVALLARLPLKHAADRDATGDGT
jgi:DNA-binding CsgD family transcriptional regulator